VEKEGHRTHRWCLSQFQGVGSLWQTAVANEGNCSHRYREICNREEACDTGSGMAKKRDSSKKDSISVVLDKMFASLDDYSILDDILSPASDSMPLANLDLPIDFSFIDLPPDLTLPEDCGADNTPAEPIPDSRVPAAPLPDPEET
jgi:hypothetical protein